MSPTKDEVASMLFPEKSTPPPPKRRPSRAHSRRNSAIAPEQNTTLFDINMTVGSKSDWINPLLRHAIYSHNNGKEGGEGRSKEFKNWSSPQFIQPSSSPRKFRLSTSSSPLPSSRPHSSTSTSIFPGDTYIRTFMKPGSATFLVNRVDNDLGVAFNEEGSGVDFGELLDFKRYELLFRGEGVWRISKLGTQKELSGSLPFSTSPPSNSPSKIDQATEKKYFGKNKNILSSSTSQSRFYNRFHVYGEETDISGVVEVPEDRDLNSSKSLNSLNLSPSTITSNKLHHNYTLTHKYKNNKDSSKSIYEEWIKKTKLPLAMYMSEGNGVRKKLEEDVPLDYAKYMEEVEEFGIGKTLKNLEPLPVKMHPSPSKALLPSSSSSNNNERPNTASFSYLRACAQNNVAPWNLVTKCENLSSPTLNLKGLSMGTTFSDCLCEGLKSESLGFLERIDFRGNKLSGKDVGKLLEGCGHMKVRGLKFGKNRIGGVGGKAVLEWLRNREGDVEMEDLDLGGCEVGESMVYFILEELGKRDGRSLKSLSICENKIKEKRIKTGMIGFLSKCPALETLDLSWNSLKDVGASDLLKYLAKPSKKVVLHEVRLGWNGISDSCTDDVINLIESKDRTVERLELNNNNFSQTAVNKIITAADKIEDFEVELEVLDVDVLGIKDETFGAAHKEFNAIQAKLDEILSRDEYKKPPTPKKKEKKKGKKKK
ncbi:hypothetical protein TL16_g12761 [Triparma laevis f. inornata]|uniref:RNI-like protein n=1 Tax=Triparma laevis f. inornata TaxID=1714386 RepID=A0A9W7EXB6_9STRA|nr:hypothetical protein TL16_g12761 [Triparma laevis f. inornata]